MRSFNFTSLEEFEKAVKQAKPGLSEAIYESISESYSNGDTTCKLFKVCIEEHSAEYEISLPKKQWTKALDSCLKDFEKYEETNLAIDCYVLRKKLLE